MFYYYGRKKQIARHYPPPMLGTIVEPFAGSAAYSLHGDNWKKNVILTEKDERVAAIWDWLINDATPEEILQMPDLQIGERTSNFLHIIHAATKMAFHYKTIKVTPVLERNWRISKRHMAANLHKIKHWQIICGNYTKAPDIEATWFIDPPYEGDSGSGYNHSNGSIRYDELAEWVLERQGEVICCEGKGASYLPFEPLITLLGIAGKRSREMIFYRSPYAPVQLSLFSPGGILAKEPQG
jgi:site-specific DNA-adenine methylase